MMCVWKSLVRCALLLTLFCLACLPCASQIMEEPGQWEYVADHPQASKLHFFTPDGRATFGRSLWTLKAWHGRLYAGYGDYNQNYGGPISITPFNPKSGSFAESPLIVADSEALGIYREIGGKLYSPILDPRPETIGLNNFVVGRLRPIDGMEMWSEHSEIPIYHAWDMATLDNSDIYFVGEGDDDPLCPNCAMVWRSTNGGSSFERILSVSPEPGISCNNCGSSFRFAGVLNGKLYVQALDASLPDNGQTYNHMQSRAYSFDGVTWTHENFSLVVNNINPHTGYQPMQFQGRMLYQSRPPFSATRKYLIAFDGQSATYLNVPTGGVNGVTNFTVDGDYLYVLTDKGEVRRTDDITAKWDTWESLPTFPDINDGSPATFGHGARSLAVLNGVLYAGTTEGTLYRLDLSDPPPPPPIIIDVN